jgi:hypothetical protein
MKDIIKAMEAFNENLVGGKRLVKALERDTPIGTMGNFFYFFSRYHTCIIKALERDTSVRDGCI